MDRTEMLSLIYNFCNEEGIELTDSAYQEMQEAGIFSGSDYNSVLEYCLENGIVLDSDQIESLKETFNYGSRLSLDEALDSYDYMYDFVCEYLGSNISESAFDTMLESGQIDVILSEADEVFEENVFADLHDKKLKSKALAAAKKELSNSNGFVNDDTIQAMADNIYAGLAEEERKKKQDKADKAQAKRDAQDEKIRDRALATTDPKKKARLFGSTHAAKAARRANAAADKAEKDHMKNNAKVGAKNAAQTLKAATT